MHKSLPIRGLAALGLAVLLAAMGPVPANAQDWRTVNRSRQVSGERELDVEVEYAAGEFTLRPADEGLLYRMELRYDQEAFSPVTELRGGRLRLGLEKASESIDGDRKAGHLDLQLAPELPMDLSLKFGAVRADLDLGGLALTDLRVTTGASETMLDVSQPNPVTLGSARLAVGAAQFEARRLANLNAEVIEVDAGVGDITLDFTGTWRQDADVSVDMGLGSLSLLFPEGLGVRIRKDSFLTKVDARDMVKRGDYYYSRDWDEADHKVDVDVDAAFGKISVSWVP